MRFFGHAWRPDSRQVALVRGPVTDGAELNLAWPAPRRVVFIARFADSDSVPGRYRLVEVDPRTGNLTPRAALATDPSPDRRVTPRFVDFDADAPSPGP